jgi:guanylate kinase
MDSSLPDSLKDYKPSNETIELIKSTPILLLVGPTGAGKDSLKDRLLEAGDYHHIVSHTTRPPRINHGVLEADGREYHFIDMQTAENMVSDKSFVEAKVYSGNLYGTSAGEIRAANDEGKIALTDIEVQGVAEYKAFDKNVMAVFLLPPDFETWQARLQRRYGDVVDAADARKRMETALDEIEQLLSTDYYAGVINDDLNETYEAVQHYASTRTIDAVTQEKAHAVAVKLADDIKAYLATTL